MDYQSTYPYSNAFLKQDLQFNQATQEIEQMRVEDTPQTDPPTPSIQLNEQAYIENILRLNKGKLVILYCSFNDSVLWKDKTFKGIIEEVGRDHIVINDPKTDKHYMIPMIFLNYAEFDESIQYQYPRR